MSKIVETIVGPFDYNRAVKLVQFLDSCDPNEEIVIYEGQECNLRFLKYVAEYLQTQFDIDI